MDLQKCEYLLISFICLPVDSDYGVIYMCNLTFASRDSWKLYGEKYVSF